MNKFFLSGNLTADPAFTAGQEESKNRANFRIAHNHNKEKTSFFNCTAWGKSAERISRLRKGQRVLVEGPVEDYEYTNQQTGVTNKDKQINVYSVEYIDFPVGNQQQQSAPQYSQPTGYQQPYGAPPPAYGAPPQQYGQPSAPPPGYGAPPNQAALPPSPQQYAAPPAQPGYPPQTPPAQAGYPPQSPPNYNYGQNPPF